MRLATILDEHLPSQDVCRTALVLQQPCLSLYDVIVNFTKHDGIAPVVVLDVSVVVVDMVFGNELVESFSVVGFVEVFVVVVVNDCVLVVVVVVVVVLGLE